jgi:hypothetical protein
VADDSGQDPQLQAIEGSAAPVFGRRATPFDERKYRQFGIEVETDRERFVEEFDAYFDPDGGAILQMMNARTQGQQANAAALLLGTSLRDDDGVSHDWTFPTEPEYDDDGEVILYVVVDDEVVPVDGDDEAALDAAPRYEWHDGELLTEAELRQAIDEFDPLEVGSSRRRFYYVMDSPRHRIQLGALTELSEWVIGDLAKRPTRRPSSSGRGPQQTTRTSGGRRSGKRG